MTKRQTPGGADANDRGTEMTFRQSGFDSADSRDGHRDGWSQCFDKLDAYLAAHRH
jgi:hypothetical protein